MSAYIPTNLISITDGQIVLDPDLFAKGVRPAIDVGRSVSRVGGKTQLPAVRSVAEELRLQYAQFEELELFTRFGSAVDKETMRKIERGRRIRELLKQLRLRPVSAAAQTALLLAVKNGSIDRVPLDRVGDFDARVRERVPEDAADVAERILDGEELSDDDRRRLAEIVAAAADAAADAVADEEDDEEDDEDGDGDEHHADRFDREEEDANTEGEDVSGDDPEDGSASS